MPSKGRDRTTVPYASRPRTDRQKVLGGLPGLCLHIECKPDGVHVYAALHVGDGAGRRWMEPVADVVFRPKEVNEDLVLQWAIGALSTYLGRKAEASAEAVVDPA